MGFGERVREARERKGMTRDELANNIGVTRSAISNYENEISHPKEPVMYALLDALDVDANFLFQDNATQKNTPSEEGAGEDVGSMLDKVKARLLNEDGIMFDNYNLTESDALLLAQSLDNVKALAKTMAEQGNAQKK